jgi:hypothetical protein
VTRRKKEPRTAVIDGEIQIQYEGHAVNVTIYAEQTGEVDSRGREAWSYSVIAVDETTRGRNLSYVDHVGEFSWDPEFGVMGMLSRLFSSAHLQHIEATVDEANARKNANNND